MRSTGLTAAPDTEMDRFARLVTSVVDVPVALVSLIEDHRQILPGAAGLAEPWASRRATPLSHSLCQHVVAWGEPLIITDAREDERTFTSEAINALRVIGYAGMPLTDGDGAVLGSLCAIDTRPHAWTESELLDLSDLAAACSAELRLRIAHLEAVEVRAEAERARHRADAMARGSADALKRSQLLLRAVTDLASTSDLEEVSAQVRELISSDLAPSYVGLVLVEGRRLRRLVDGSGPDLARHIHEVYDLNSAWPSAHAARENTTVVLQGAEGLERAGYGGDAVRAFRTLELETVICAPLPGTPRPLGTLVIGWGARHEVDTMDRAMVTALAGYTARAVERALFIENRIAVTRQMQEALLTSLPLIDGLEIAAFYRPSAEEEMIGGDWYDAYPLPPAVALDATVRGETDGLALPGRTTAAARTNPALRGNPALGTDRTATLALTIGDITGHDMHAATLMGQARSMLRQADLDHHGASPAHIVTALERAIRALRLDVSGTLVHTHLRPHPTEPGWEMTWTNAGHPAPLVHHPATGTRELRGHDLLIHPDLPPYPRTAHHTLLPPGATMMQFTDGLVEKRDEDMDLVVARAGRLLAEGASLELPRLVGEIARQVAGPRPQDDVALVAVRVPPSYGLGGAPQAG